MILKVRCGWAQGKVQSGVESSWSTKRHSVLDVAGIGRCPIVTSNAVADVDCHVQILGIILAMAF